MRVLVIITTSLVAYGGIANAFMNYFRNMNLSDLVIDVVSCSEHDDDMAKEIEMNGGKVIDVPSKQKHPIMYCFALNKIISNGYDVVDVHGNSATMAIEMFLSNKNGVKNRMAHCLNSKTSHPIIHRIMSAIFNKLCNNKTACTKESGKFLYGDNDFVVLKNTIPTDVYKYSEEYRKNIRDEYGINEDTVLIGTVGKINAQKNHLFLVDVLKNVIETNNNVKFLLVGDGPLRGKLEEEIMKRGLGNFIILAGMKSDVIPFYSAFDIYLFPSIFEGESLALLEAKCSGIFGCASSSIKLVDDDECDNITYKDLYSGEWAKYITNCIMKLGLQDRHMDSAYAIAKIKARGLDSVDNAEILRKLYLREDM